MPKATIDPGPISFVATIEQGGHDGGCWVVFPHDLKQLYGIGNLVPIVATFDGVEYRGVIGKMGPEPRLLVRKDVRQRLGKREGDSVQVTVALDTQPRTIEVPRDLRDALEASPASRATFEGLSYTYQKEYVQWISSAKRQQTRQRRIAGAIEKLADGKRSPTL